MKMRTIIYNDLNESNYIFTYNNLDFYFSSRFYLEKFKNSYLDFNIVNFQEIREETYSTEFDKGGIAKAVKAAKKAEAQRKREEAAKAREAARKKKQEEKEKRWAELDKRDEMKAKAKEEKRKAKERERKRKALQAAAREAEKDARALEAYVEKYRKQKEKDESQ